ncbi:hypothetical protein GCM10009765_25990 [Fodinicola feengrottensis]|uniref:Uncharacterized protein n=1 Tax=Fodinicola feengrottensis TaxID=435914 RepID=A0ABP4SV87_9ACTN
MILAGKGLGPAHHAQPGPRQAQLARRDVEHVQHPWNVREGLNPELILQLGVQGRTIFYQEEHLAIEIGQMLDPERRGVAPPSGLTACAVVNAWEEQHSVDDTSSQCSGALCRAWTCHGFHPPS